MVAPTSSGYSASVRLSLRVNGQQFEPAQIGGGMLIFDHPITLPGDSGELHVHIDDHLHRWKVTWDPSATPRRTIVAQFEELGDQRP
jgi:hypothetical protein